MSGCTAMPWWCIAVAVEMLLLLLLMLLLLQFLLPVEVLLLLLMMLLQLSNSHRAEMIWLDLLQDGRALLWKFAIICKFSSEAVAEKQPNWYHQVWVSLSLSMLAQRHFLNKHIWADPKVNWIRLELIRVSTLGPQMPIGFKNSELWCYHPLALPD